MTFRRLCAPLPLLALALLWTACSGSQPNRARPPASSARGAASNRPPVIEEITTLPLYLPKGGGGTTRASASDPDLDRIIYNWEITGGKITGGEKTPVVSWVADEGAGQVLLTVSVKDRAAFAERKETITLTDLKLDLEVVPPAKAKEGEALTLILRTQGVENLSGAALRVVFPSESMRLQGIFLEGLSTDAQTGWTLFSGLPKPGTLDLAMLSHGGEERKGGKILRLEFTLRDDSLPPEGSIGFATAASNQGLWDKRGQAMPVALVDPTEDKE